MACGTPCAIDSFPTSSWRRRARLEQRSRSVAGSSNFGTHAKTVVVSILSLYLGPNIDSNSFHSVSSLLGKSGSQEPECKAETSPTPDLGGRQLSNSPTPPPDETMAIYVQLECPSERQGVPTSTPQVHLKPNDMDTPHYLYLMPLSRHPSDPLPPAYPSPSSTLSSFSSLVELVSPFPLSEETTWTVYKDKTLIHQDRTAIRMTSPLPNAAGRRVYICELVPSLWPLLCESEGA